VRKFVAEVFALGGISCDPEGHPKRLDALIWPPDQAKAPRLIAKLERQNKG
jgi:hypothetical protein